MTPKPLVKSKCCKAKMIVNSTDEGTCFWICSDCGKSCDPLETSGLKQQIKDIVDEAYNANLDLGKITKAPVGASGVNTGSSKNYKSIIAWALKALSWDDPGYAWTYEKKVLKMIIKIAEQRGYERAKRELSIKYGGQG